MRLASVIVTSVPWTSVTVTGRCWTGFVAIGCSAASAITAVEWPWCVRGSGIGVTSARRGPPDAPIPPRPGMPAHPASVRATSTAVAAMRRVVGDDPRAGRR